MHSSPRTLPQELSALVHHVELNQAGWADKALCRLVMAILWLNDTNLDQAQIQAAMRATFNLSISIDKLTSVITQLASDNSLLELPRGQYRLPETTRSQLTKETAEATKAAATAKDCFCSLALSCCPELDPAYAWEAFESALLIPMIREFGANTNRLLLGASPTTYEKHIEHFSDLFEKHQEAPLKSIVARFLDPRNPDIRAYVTRLLHAYFCVEAIALSSDVLERLNATTSRPLFIHLFVDTNFLFSLLAIHENPSNTSAKDLTHLLATMTTNPEVRLFVLPRTITEAKRALVYAKEFVSGIPKTGSFTEATLQAASSGLVARFFSERKLQNNLLSAESWFDPYIDNLVLVARDAGIELHEAQLTNYESRRDVADDINSIMGALSNNNRDALRRTKSYDQAAHDMTLWHYVRELRPPTVESPIEARSWILTVDYGLIRFDLSKVAEYDSSTPVCLLPTSLVQLLQFWVPRTQEFEEAMLGSLRMPFLFQELDAAAERVSIKIIERLGSLEGSHNLSENTITSIVMNESLRSRIADGISKSEEVASVRQVYYDEMQLLVKKERDAAHKLEMDVAEKAASLQKHRENIKSTELENRQLRQELRAAHDGARSTDNELSRIEEENRGLRDRFEELADRTTVRKSSLQYWTFLGAFLFSSGLVGYLAVFFVPATISTHVRALLRAATGVTAFLLLHSMFEIYARRRQRFQCIWPFANVSKFRKKLWIVLVALAIQVAGVLIAELF